MSSNEQKTHLLSIDIYLLVLKKYFLNLLIHN